jgi:predicted MFS family arabinose efflux permease
MRYDTDGRERLLTGHAGRLFVLLTFALVAMKLAQRVLPPLLPVITDDLVITPFAAGVALSVLRLARAGMQYPGGLVADQLTRTTIIVPSLVLAIAGLGLLSLSPTYAVLLVALVVFGAGLGLYSPATKALLSDLYQEKRGRAFGLHMMGGDFAGILAAGVAIGIVAVATWRAAFLLSLLVLLPVPVVFYRLSRESVSTSISSVDPEIRETTARLVGDPQIRWVVLAYMLFVVAGSGVASFLPTFLAEVHGFSFAFASSAFALLYAVGIVSMPAAGTASDRFPRLIVASGSLAVAAAGLVVLVGAPAEVAVVGAIVVYAVGQRALPPALQAHLMDRFPDDSMGGDFGAIRTLYMTVGSAGPAYTGFVAGTFGYVPAYASLAVLYLVAGGILVRLFLIER